MTYFDFVDSFRVGALRDVRDRIRVLKAETEGGYDPNKEDVSTYTQKLLTLHQLERKADLLSGKDDV